jgi:VWFA-related protein
MTEAKKRVVHCLGIFLGFLVFLCPTSSLFPKGKKAKDAESQGRMIIKVPVNVVIVKATIKDKAGNPVTDLTVDDFKLYEDGKPQSIHTFALESYEPPALEETIIPSPSPNKGAQTERKDTRPRMISLIVDDLTMKDSLDFQRVVSDSKEFVKRDMLPGDLVSVLSGSRKVQFPFSDDK